MLVIVWGSIAGLLLPGFSLAQNQQPVVDTPETLKDAVGFVFSILKSMPRTIKEAFQLAWKIWSKMADWLWAQWDKYIWSWIQGLWHSFLGLMGQEIEKRKPMVEQELEKEKQEIKEEIKQEAEKAGQSLWERLKELVKSKL